MTYTTQQLQAMSDHTVNHALYAKLYYSSNVDLPEFCPDYCNNPNDIMPLAFERGISIVHTNIKSGKDFWITVIGVENLIDGKDISAPHFGDINPLRAIAGLILMMED